MNNLHTSEKFTSIFMAACLFLLTIEPASAQWQSNWKSCFNLAEGFISPTQWSGPPVIDGTVAGDLGWTKAWRYVHHNGTIHDVVVQLAQAQSDPFVYLSFEVNNDSALNATDTIVVAFDTAAGANSKKLLEIKPLINGDVRMGPDPDNPAGPQIATPQLNYYTANVLPFGSGTTVPASTRARTTKSGSGSNWSWWVELKLSKADLGIPTTGTFGLYFNILIAQGTGTGPTGLTNEYAWPVPFDSSEWLLGSPTEVPAVGKWGTATADVNVPCSGVYINTQDIGTTNSPPTKLILGQQNTIRANIHNSSIDTNGNPKQAKLIKAKFKYATFGMSQVWHDVPADAGSKNPTDPINITTSEFRETKWTVPLNNPDFPDGGKTCILAELDTEAVPTGPNDWTTVFVNKSAWNNFYYSTASRVEAAPVIDSRGWESPPDGTQHQLELFVTSRIDEIDNDIALASTKDGHKKSISRTKMRDTGPWAELAYLTNFPVERGGAFREYMAALLEAQSQVSQLVYTMHGCQRSGKYIRIDETELEICGRVGSFGFGMRHAGIGETNWETAIEGAEYVDGNRNHLRMFIEEGERKTLKLDFTATNAIGGGDLYIGFHLGETFPQGSFSNAYDGDTAVDVFVEYMMFPDNNLALEASLGQFSFADKNNVQDIDVTRFAVNGKWYFPINTYRWFATLGLGSYSFDPGSTEFGGFAGAGIQYDITPRWSVEGRYEINAISSNSPNSNYGVALVGLRFGL